MGMWGRHCGVIAAVTVVWWVSLYRRVSIIKLHLLIQLSHLSMIYCSSTYLPVRSSPWIHYHTSSICAQLSRRKLSYYGLPSSILSPDHNSLLLLFFIMSLPAFCADALTTVRFARPQHLFYMHICLYIFQNYIFLYFIGCMHMCVSVCDCRVTCGCLICGSWRYKQLWAAEWRCCEQRTLTLCKNSTRCWLLSL